MPLAHAAAPERIISAVGKCCVGVQAGKREEARIPSAADDADGACLAGRGIHVGKMLGDVGVRVKAVHDVEQLGKLGRLLGEVGGTSSAEHHDVNLVCHSRHVIPCIDGGVRRHTHRRWVATREDGHEVHVVCLGDRCLNAACKIPVTSDSHLHARPP